MTRPIEPNFNRYAQLMADIIPVKRETAKEQKSVSKTYVLNADREIPSGQGDTKANLDVRFKNGVKSIKFNITEEFVNSDTYFSYECKEYPNGKREIVISANEYALRLDPDGKSVGYGRGGDEYLKEYKEHYLRLIAKARGMEKDTKYVNPIINSIYNDLMKWGISE